MEVVRRLRLTGEMNIVLERLLWIASAVPRSLLPEHLTDNVDWAVEASIFAAIVRPVTAVLIWLRVVENEPAVDGALFPQKVARRPFPGDSCFSPPKLICAVCALIQRSAPAVRPRSPPGP